MKSTPSSSPTLGFWSLVSIGIGGMVGGSLFAVLGIAALTARGATPLAFLFAGVIALLTSYSFAKLSIAYPGIGGTVTFLDQAFGYGTATGALNVLLCISYIVLISLNAHAVGNYGIRFFPDENSNFWKAVLMSGTVILLTLLNALGPRLVVKSELAINILKLLILTTFVLAGFGSIHWSRMAPGTWSSGGDIVSGAVVLVLCYQGFELMANASNEVRHPKRNIPRAFYGCVLMTIVLYALISFVALGNLPLSEIEKNSGSSLAEAARPFLGQWGFSLLAIAGLIAAGSAINAALYGSARISFIIAKRGQLPKALSQRVWNRPIEGLLIVSALTLLVANFMDLASISLLASAGFLLVYAAVNAANFKLRRHTRSRPLIPLLALFSCLGALITTLIQTWQKAPNQVGQVFGMLALVILFEWIYQRKAGRRRRASMEEVEKQTESPAPH